jgi:hypothetical protein
MATPTEENYLLVRKRLEHSLSEMQMRIGK